MIQSNLFVCLVLNTVQFLDQLRICPNLDQKLGRTISIHTSDVSNADMNLKKNERLGAREAPVEIFKAVTSHLDFLEFCRFLDLFLFPI